MDRRNFLKTTGTFIAGATIARSAARQRRSRTQLPPRAGLSFP